MKTLKILLLALSITFLFGCETKQEDITFDNETFVYVGVTDDDYQLFRNGNDDLEVILNDDETITASYVKNQDIFLIMGTEEDYQIRKNGSLIQICSFTDDSLTCTGSEFVQFNHDVDILFGVFEEPGISITFIILGALVITAGISLFFVPKTFLDKLKIKNIKIGQLFILRLVTLLMLGIGITIIILSL